MPSIDPEFALVALILLISSPMVYPVGAPHFGQCDQPGCSCVPQWEQERSEADDPLEVEAGGVNMFVRPPVFISQTASPAINTTGAARIKSINRNPNPIIIVTPFLQMLF